MPLHRLLLAQLRRIYFGTTLWFNHCLRADLFYFSFFFLEPPRAKSGERSIVHFTGATLLHNNLSSCLWTGIMNSLVGAKLLVWSELLLQGPGWCTVRGSWAYFAVCATDSRSMADNNPTIHHASLLISDAWSMGVEPVPVDNGSKAQYTLKEKNPHIPTDRERLVYVTCMSLDGENQCKTHEPSRRVEWTQKSCDIFLFLVQIKFK